MTDEQQPVVETPVEGTPVETPPAPEQAHVETPAPVSWQDELAKLDPKEFRKIINQHDKLAGTVGYMMQQERQAIHFCSVVCGIITTEFHAREWSEMRQRHGLITLIR